MVLSIHLNIYLEMEKIPVYDVVYPVVINGELLGAVNIGFSMVGVYETIRSNSANMSFWGAIAGFLIASILFTSSNYAVKTIDKLKGLMDSMARGDFTNKVPEILLKRKDEFGEISRSVDIMQNSISNIIRKVLGSSEDVASHSEELTATIEHSTAAAAEVAVVIEGIAGSANDQANDTENGLIAITELGNKQSASVDMTDKKFEGISESIEEMQKVIRAVNEANKAINRQKEEIVKIMENLSAISEENAAASQQASASVEEQTAGMSEIARASEELARIAEELNRQVEQFRI